MDVVILWSGNIVIRRVQNIYASRCIQITAKIPKIPSRNHKFTSLENPCQPLPARIYKAPSRLGGTPQSRKQPRERREKVERERKRKRKSRIFILWFIVYSFLIYATPEAQILAFSFADLKILFQFLCDSLMSSFVKRCCCSSNLLSRFIAGLLMIMLYHSNQLISNFIVPIHP